MSTGPSDGTPLRESAAKGVAWALLQSGGSRLLTAATFVILARLLSPHVFGVVAFASVAISFLGIFVQQGFGQALVQIPLLEERHKNTAFWISLGFGCLLAVVTIAASWPLAAALHLPEVGPVLRVLSIGFVLSGLSSVQRAILQRQMAFRQLTARPLLGNFVGAAVGITCALLGAGVWSLVAQTLSAAAVGVVVLWTATGWRPALAVSKDTYFELFRFSKNTMGSNVMLFFDRRTDDFFIGTFLGPAQLGVYSVAFRFLTIMLDVGVGTVATVALPTFARLQHDVDRLRTAYLTATRLSAVVALPMFLFMVVGAGEVIQVFFGAKWEASIPVTRVLAMIGVANTLANFNGTVLTALGRPDIVLRYLTISAVANVLAVAIAVQWGILAVAWSLVVRTWLFMLPLSIFYLTRHLAFGIGEYLRGYVPTLTASVALMCFGLTVHMKLISVMGAGPRLAVMVLGGVIVYVAVLGLLDRGLLRQLAAFVQTTLPRRAT